MFFSVNVGHNDGERCPFLTYWRVVIISHGSLIGHYGDVVRWSITIVTRLRDKTSDYVVNMKYIKAFNSRLYYRFRYGPFIFILLKTVLFEY